jgi:hypothetical protein
MSEARPEILLKTDTKTIVRELGREGKFLATPRGCGERGHQSGRADRNQCRPRPLANR